VKSLIRYVCFALMLSGWIVAALCIHIVRTPDPNNPRDSKIVVVPKNRLGVHDEYVDARTWTMADVPDHATVVLRMLEAGKADELKFLADPKSNQDVETQLTDAIADAKPNSPGLSTRPVGLR
jgi:hypothetical protein